MTISESRSGLGCVNLCPKRDNPRRVFNHLSLLKDVFRIRPFEVGELVSQLKSCMFEIADCYGQKVGDIGMMPRFFYFLRREK